MTHSGSDSRNIPKTLLWLGAIPTTTHRVKNTKLTLYGYEPLQKLHCKSSPQREVSGASKRRDGERRRTWSQVMSHNKVSAARRCSQTILGVPADSSLLTRNTVKVGGLAEKNMDCWKLTSDLPKSFSRWTLEFNGNCRLFLSTCLEMIHLIRMILRSFQERGSYIKTYLTFQGSKSSSLQIMFSIYS